MLSFSKTLKVYKSSKLNNANFADFNLTDYQVFLYLISKIGGTDKFEKYLQPKELETKYVLTSREFSKIFFSVIVRTLSYLLKICYTLKKEVAR